MSAAGEDCGDSRSILPRNSTISLSIVDNDRFTRECISRSLRDLGHNIDIAAFATCEDYLQSVRVNDLILYHAHMSAAAFSNGTDLLADLKKVMQIVPVVVLCADDSPDSVFEAFENGARGYIATTDTTLELAIEVIHLVRAGGMFLPPSCLFPRKIGPPHKEDRTGDTARELAGAPFTPRQMTVLEQLTLGKANKIIAHHLRMSESTVKVHIRNIMKKMKATNRTEVACRAQALIGSRKSNWFE